MTAAHRPATPDDVAAVGDLIRRAERHDGVPRVLADEELADDLDSPTVDLVDDTRVAELDGEVVGWCWVDNSPATDRLERAEVHGEVDPAHRGHGIGRQLLGWGVGRARQRLGSRTHGLPRFIRVAAYDWLEDRHRLYRRAGFEAVRWNDELLRPLVDLPDVVVPDGYALEPWPDDRDEELRVVRNAAFADHWGSTVVGPDPWRSFVRGHGSRPGMSVIAIERASGSIVGLCANQAYPEDDEVTGRRDAWIANVGTLRSARGRGLATAMLSWSLRSFAANGFSHAVLEVDSANPTGAGRLYRGLGFEPLHRSVTYEIEVPADGAPA